MPKETARDSRANLGASGFGTLWSPYGCRILHVDTSASSAA